MQIVEVKCVSCGAKIKNESFNKTMVCEYCQTTNIIDSPYKMFCTYCGNSITETTCFCTKCGRETEYSLKQKQSQPQPQVINYINYNYGNTDFYSPPPPLVIRNPKNKWVALLLCLFLGYFGAHKFYEGKIGMGVLYIFTFGLFFIGWGIDFLVLLFKPNTYYI